LTVALVERCVVWDTTMATGGKCAAALPPAGELVSGGTSGSDTGTVEGASSPRTMKRGETKGEHGSKVEDARKWYSLQIRSRLWIGNFTSRFNY
jgi:hypothetical protein